MGTHWQPYIPDHLKHDICPISTKGEIDDFKNKRKANHEVKEEKLCSKKRKRDRHKKKRKIK